MNTPNPLLRGAYYFSSCIARINHVAQYEIVVSEATHAHLRDAYTHEQLTSKLAAISHLIDLHQTPTIVLGQWHGLLPLLLTKFRISSDIVGVELDPFWSDFSRRVMSQTNYTEIQADITDTAQWESYIGEKSLVINTSCEHMSWDWLRFQKKNSGTLYVQSTNYQHHTHVNTVNSEDEVAAVLESYGFTVEKKYCLKFHPYNRYCVMAKWN
jgi:hypothetical protein